MSFDIMTTNYDELAGKLKTSNSHYERKLAKPSAILIMKAS
jgi:hypothetical protein